jgi:hypothetical protein
MQLARYARVMSAKSDMSWVRMGSKERSTNSRGDLEDLTRRMARLKKA